jgi:hypothetical protein
MPYARSGGYSARMTRSRIPDEVLTAAHDRSLARVARDWPEADRLRATIEDAGWKVEDRGTDFALSLAHARDVVEGERVRYGTSRSVPSRIEEPPVGLATVVLIATDWPADVARMLDGLIANAPLGTSIVIVGNGPSAEQSEALDAAGAAPSGRLPVEVAWTSERLGRGATINVGLRRVTGPIAILLDSCTNPTGDFVTPLIRALDDATIAIAGPWGAVSADLRHFAVAQAGDVVAIDGACQAFRRADYVERGPLDERFTHHSYLDIWWSLVLRDRGEVKPPGRAVSLDGLPIVRHEQGAGDDLADVERERLVKRNFYRFLDRFGARRDLLVRPG